MQGFDYARAQKDLEIPKEFKVEAMIALGKEGPKEACLRRFSKTRPRATRRRIEDSVVEGKFSRQLVHSKES